MVPAPSYSRFNPAHWLRPSEENSMIRRFAILGFAALTVSAAIASNSVAAPNKGGYGAVSSVSKKKPKTVCFEQGCTGDRCISCTR